MNSKPFSDRKAIKYFKIAAEQNSVEACLGIGRLLSFQQDQGRHMGDYIFTSSNRFKSSLKLLPEKCFDDIEKVLSFIQRNQINGETEVVHVKSVPGYLLFRLKRLNDSELLVLNELSPLLLVAYGLLKEWDPSPRFILVSCLRKVSYTEMFRAPILYRSPIILTQQINL